MPFQVTVINRETHESRSFTFDSHHWGWPHHRTHHKFESVEEFSNFVKKAVNLHNDFLTGEASILCRVCSRRFAEYEKYDEHECEKKNGPKIEVKILPPNKGGRG